MRWSIMPNPKNTPASHPFSLTAKKHLGQNFLVNERVKKRIIDACDLKTNDTAVEIGPGQGALTELIAPVVKTLYAVEKDPRLCRMLKEKFPQPPVYVVQTDILAYNFSHSGGPVKVIGNLPYYISTPIIQRLLEFRNCFTDIFLTLQLEFAERLTARVGTKEYGSLSCFVQYYAQTKILFKIPPHCFHPQPKVTSCFVHIQPRQPALDCHDETLLFQIIQRAFQDRRKKVENALAGMVGKDTCARLLGNLGLLRTLRPENLSLEDYVQLTNSYVEGNTAEGTTSIP